MSDTSHEQRYCTVHTFGPVNENSTQKSEHIRKSDTSCKWETYDPKLHLEKYDDTKIKKKKPKTDSDDESNPVEKIYDFARSHVKKIVVSKTDNNQVFVLFEHHGHLESLDVTSSRAKAWLKSSYHKLEDRIYGDESYKSALGLIQAHAIMGDTPREEIYNRIAMPDNDSIYYDLADPNWNIAKITEEGVSIVPLSKDTPIFVRRQQQQTQVAPQLEDNGNALDELTSLLRIKNEDKKLFQIHLISLFLENVPIPIMAIFGEHGSIKSTITKSAKQIVDPAGEGNASLPRSNKDLVLFLYNRYLANFDNVSEFNQEVSDTFCKAITGDSQSKRALYENSDEIIFDYRRKLIFNGIAPSIDYADLRDRCLSYETVPLKKSERITEEEFKKRFTKLLPSVLGKIFQTLSGMLEIRDSVKEEIKSPERMADFTVSGECISRVLGYTPFSFIAAFEYRVQTDSVDIVETYPIIQLIQKVLNDADHYEDTVSSFYKSIKSIAGREEIEIDSKKVDFPQAPNKVKAHIQKLKPNLRSLGFEIDIQAYNKRDKKHSKGSHVIYITRIDSEGSILSNNAKVPQPPLPSLPVTEQAQKELFNGSDNGSDNSVEKPEPLPIPEVFTPKTSLVDMADMVEIESHDDISQTHTNIMQKNSSDSLTSLATTSNNSQMCGYTCQNCSITWKTDIPLEEIQAQHSMNNENHTVIPEEDGI